MVECRMGEPPNPPELAQAIAAMLTGRDEETALLRELVAQGRAPRPEHHHQPPAPGYPEFLATQPPLFHKADEPLAADSWLRTIESKFTLHPYNDGDKAGLAAQQLRGPARTWWGESCGNVPRGHLVHLGSVQGGFQSAPYSSRCDPKEAVRITGVSDPRGGGGE